MNITDILENSIKTALKGLKLEESKVVLEHPEDLTHGDYSTNIAMSMAKKAAQNPKALAEKIVLEINKNKPKEVSRVEVAGTGFINFYLSPEFFVMQSGEILKAGKGFGINGNLKGEKTIIEYTDPNPFKEFHIGHLMSNAIGESISRIIEANGAMVTRANYQGDVGLHVAKTIWGVQRMMEKDQKTKNEFFGGLFGIGKNPRIWGKAYAFGAKAYEEDEKAKKEIVEINKKVYGRTDHEINEIYDVGRKVSLAEFEKIYKLLDTYFDEYFFESETNEFGKNLVLDNIKTGVFEKSDGAVIFKGENYGLHTRVFINSEGLPTYEAKDLGLAKIKYDRTQYDRSIVVTGNDINEYFKVLLKALSFIYPDLSKKTVHIPHGMLRMPEGKMSSRTGDVITAISLIEDVKEKVLQKMDDRGMGRKEQGEVAEKVTIGALKYSILKQVTGKDIIFDFEKSLSFEGDSGPYLQYSYARARSILRKAKDEKIKLNSKKVGKEINTLEKMLYRFPEVVERAGNEYSPHYIATYLIELSSSFNNFYAHNKIVDKDNADSSYNISLTEAFSIVLRNGLDLLGIQAPERM
ncbi:MAG: arginine--tRNA ligase [Candidatus Paceibacterota bacterium]|jgi:arginyl-tRNA synthetase